MNNLTESSTSLLIPNNECNSNSLTTFDLSVFDMMQSVSIGDNNFMYVNTFKIDNLINLKNIIIGQNSFTTRKNSWGDNPFRSFHLLNCDELESIEIGRYSFSDYGGGFELINLPKLSTIKIGSIESDISESNNEGWSVNFICSSFVVKGNIDMILVMNRSSTFEFH